MPVFDAVNNTFTAISTGGMSIKNINMGFYNNDLFYIISMIMMIIGATSFLSHYQAIKTRGKSIFSDIQFKAMIGVIIVASLLLILANNILPIDAIYSVVSAITTTGASINPSGYFTDYNAFIKVIIIVLMFIGGAAGSTVGAVKIIRVITLLRGIYKNIINIISPEGRVINMELSNKNLKETQVREASSYISLYLIFIVIGWSVLVFYGYDGMNSLFEIVSAQGNVGLSVGIVNGEMPIGAKIITIFNMWIGRLEIIPVLVILRSFIEIFKGVIPKKNLLK
nr:potassium transporter TrkG [Methanobrevibacter arboriphilus]